MSKLDKLFGDQLPDTLDNPFDPDFTPAFIHDCVEGEYLPGLEEKIFISTRHFPLDAARNASKGFPRVHPAIGRWAKTDVPSTDEMVFLDTETSGLAGGTGTFAFLIGIGKIRNESMEIRQYFMTDPAWEPLLLKAVGEEMTPGSAIISFNGKSFDMNLLKRRFSFHSLPFPGDDCRQIDLLHLSRRIWRNVLPSCSLQELERSVLGAHRKGVEDIPGSMIPQAYFNYLRFARTEYMSNIFYHNAIDVRSMADLLDEITTVLSDPVQACRSSLYPVNPSSLGRFFQVVGDEETSMQVFEYAVKDGIPLHILMNLSRLYKRKGYWDRAKELWLKGADRGHVFAMIELAKLAEHRERDIKSALKWTTMALNSDRLNVREAGELRHRLKRLAKAVGNKNPD